MSMAFTFNPDQPNYHKMATLVILGEQIQFAVSKIENIDNYFFERQNIGIRGKNVYVELIGKIKVDLSFF